MNWYIGQEIVAIENQREGRFKKDDHFTIKALRSAFCSCKSAVLIDIGIVAGVGFNNSCMGCGKSEFSNNAWFGESMFSPLDELCNISELTEILETTKPFEV